MKSSICLRMHIYFACVCLVSFLSTFPECVNLRAPIHKIRLRGLVFVWKNQEKNRENSRKRVVC